MQQASLRYDVLEDCINCKGLALALEAIHAARHILKSPKTCRGGPWQQVKLSPGWQSLARRVASCRSPSSVAALGEELPESDLQKHLLDYEFAPKAIASHTSARTVRCASVRHPRSGPPGNVTRKGQLALGEYARGSIKHVQLKRGLPPS